MSNGDFLKEDRERAIRTETLVGQLVKNQDNLPCKRDPDWRGKQEERTTSTEKKVNKMIGAIVAIVVGLALAAIKAVAGLF